MESKISSKEFYRKWLAVGIQSSWGKTGKIELAATLLGGLVAYLFPQLDSLIRVLIWAVPLAVLILTFVYSLIRAPFKIYQEIEKAGEESLLELEVIKERKLAIIYSVGAPYEQKGPGSYHGFRVGVEAKGKRTIEGVHVELVEMEPPENAYLPINLHIKGNDPPQEPKFRFTLDPGEREYIDVVYNYGDIKERYFYLFYADSHKPNQMPAKEYPYRITLRAYGKDVIEPCEESFKLNVDESGKLHFYHEDYL